MKTLIFSGSLLVNPTLPLLPDGALLVENGIIKAVDTYSNLKNIPDVELLDLRPYTILAGLIDAHVHLVGTPKPGGFVGTQFENDEWLLLRASANAREALTAGITTVRDCGGRGIIVQSLRKAVNEGLVPGPRIISSGMPITTTAGHCYYLGVEADGVTELQKAVRDNHKAGVDFIKVMVTGGGVTPGSNSRASQFSQEELNAIVEDAHRLGKKVSGHVHGTEGIARAVKAGFDTLEHCSWLSRYGEDRDYDENIAEQILEKGIYVCRSIAGFERMPLEEANPTHRFWNDYLVFRKMVKAGIKIIAGTDSGIDHTPITGLVTTLETMAGMGDMTNQAVLESTSTIAATALGINDQVGTLEIGKKADLIAVLGNPLLDLKVLRKAAVVIKEGVIAARDGHLVF